MRVIAVIQARMGSTRLRGKTLMPLSKGTLLDLVIHSVKQNKFIDDYVIATTTMAEDDSIEEYCKIENIKCFRGHSENVLSRFTDIASRYFPDDIIVRVTADNPLNNSKATTELFKVHVDNDNDYTHVEGLAHTVYEFISVRSFLRLKNSADLTSYDREHVTAHFRKNLTFKTLAIKPASINLDTLCDKLLTVDTEDDYHRIYSLSQSTDLYVEKLDFDTVCQLLKSKIHT